ncbi:hypothetical protein Cni_G09841 [Canna indica]|uniref:Uncharacterized protein n=1 Tax=Canna indica TaxID=4628 RepID=A0AAQ3K6F2_9LILI|nr:hypothetical protein Cni_G09841 [Canna indica]
MADDEGTGQVQRPLRWLQNDALSSLGRRGLLQQQAVDRNTGLLRRGARRPEQELGMGLRESDEGLQALFHLFLRGIDQRHHLIDQLQQQNGQWWG